MTYYMRPKKSYRQKTAPLEVVEEPTRHKQSRHKSSATASPTSFWSRIKHFWRRMPLMQKCVVAIGVTTAVTHKLYSSSVTILHQPVQRIEDLESVLQSQTTPLQFCNKPYHALVAMGENANVYQIVNPNIHGDEPPEDCNKILHELRKSYSATFNQTLDMFSESFSKTKFSCSQQVMDDVANYMIVYMGMQLSRHMFTRIGNCGEMYKQLALASMLYDIQNPRVTPLVKGELILEGIKGRHSYFVIFQEGHSPNQTTTKGQGIKAFNNLFDGAYIIDAWGHLSFFANTITTPNGLHAPIKRRWAKIFAQTGVHTELEQEKSLRDVARYYEIAFEKWSINRVTNRPSDPCAQKNLEIWEKRYTTENNIPSEVTATIDNQPGLRHHPCP